MILGDRIAVMRSGTLEQVAPPGELIARPRTGFVSEFLGRGRIQLRLDAMKVGDVTDTSPNALADAGRAGCNNAVKSDAPLSGGIEVMAGLGSAEVVVTDTHGNPVGLLRKDSLLRVIGNLLSGGD